MGVGLNRGGRDRPKQREGRMGLNRGRRLLGQDIN